MTILTHWEGEPVGVLQGLWDVPLLEVHDRIGSTNDRVRALAGEGAAPFTTVIAESQSAGRGRSGARWHDSAGDSLLISVLLPRGGEVSLHLPLLVGLAAVRSVERTVPELDVGVQWPNDVMVDGRKAGGVLCETTRGGVVAGIGLNVRQKPSSFPEEVRPRAVSLEAASRRSVSRGALAGALARELRGLFGAPAGPEIPAPAYMELRAHDTLADRPVETVQEGRGIAQGIARDGALLLERPDGSRVRVVAGGVRVL